MEGRIRSSYEYALQKAMSNTLLDKEKTIKGLKSKIDALENEKKQWSRLNLSMKMKLKAQDQRC